MKEKKCEACGEQMIKGAVSNPGEVDTMWYSRESLLKSMLGKDMVAWACNNCGNIQLALDIKK